MHPIYHMIVFEKVVALGSFTRAAEALGHTKSTVSRYISQLEDEWGVLLLKRTTRSFVLTEAGEKLFVYASQMAGISEQAQELMEDWSVAPKGLLRITLPHVFADSILARALSRYCLVYPEIELDLIFEDQKLNLIEHNIDVAISVGMLEDSTYKAQRIMHLQDVLCASPAYLSEHWYGLEGAEELLGDLATVQSLDFVSARWQGKRFSCPLVHLETGRQRRVTLSARVVSNSLPAAAALVREGLGVGVLPYMLIQRALEEGQLVPLLPGYEIPEHPVFAVFPYQDKTPPKVRTLLLFLKEALEEDEGHGH